jgi:ABC-type uncharacterized transport system ATPase subunit
VRGAQVDGRVRLLSGGNMQKLILGRVLEAGRDILVAAQPSRGLDEGAIAGVHRRLIEARARGAGVSADLRGSRRGDRAVRPDPRHRGRAAVAR